jgi:ABC-type nitrate/sulfonate/bicarbonate transport system substrate-binding protein
MHRLLLSKRPLRLLWLLFVPLLFTAVPANAADSIIIGMAGLNFSFLPFQVALEKRFYEKYDLSVKPVLMRAQSAIPALISGDIDYDTHFGSLVRGAVSGLPVRVIFSTAEKQMFSFVVQPDIKSVENLKGKIIGISSFGGTQHLVTVAALRALGIDPDRDVKVINVGDEGIRAQQLRAKQIHAAMINPPMSVVLRKEGFRLLLESADYVDLPLTGLGATTKKLSENPEQAKRVVRALNESLQFIRSNRKETVAIFARWLKMDPETAADTYDVAVKILSADGTASDKAINGSIEEAKSAGKIKGNFAPRDVSDFSLVKSVISEKKK